LIKHARYYWLLLAESHLTRRLFGSMVRWIAALAVPAAERALAAEDNLARKGDSDGEVSVESVEKAGVMVPRFLGRSGTGPLGAGWAH
jgi:hypothetical protein